MARIRLYQMYDKQAGIVSGPILAVNRDAAAIRAFNDVLAQKDSDPGRYPEDFELLLIGEQDQESGAIVAWNPSGHQEVIATGAEWLAAQERQAVSGE